MLLGEKLENVPVETLTALKGTTKAIVFVKKLQNRRYT